MTRAQQTLLVVLRTLIGWHFLYEGYVKAMQPAWGPDGAPIAPWSAAGYLRGAGGPLASVFHAVGSSSWIGTIDTTVTIALVAIGLSLILGCFTQAGCWGAIGLLTLFYLSAIPTSGVSEARSEGTYLLVNKNLIELIAVAVVLVFRTGRLAGLDRWFASVRREAGALEEAAA